MSDVIRLSGVAFEYAAWRIWKEIIGRDPDAPCEVIARVAEALAFYGPHVPPDDMREVESMSRTWKGWTTERLEVLYDSWEPNLPSGRYPVERN